jgi:HEAT repeat protein
MFNWFSPRCPVDPPDKVWIERRMTWLTHVLGIDRCRDASVVLPIPQFFPGPYAGEEADAGPLFDRTCEYMGVDSGRFDLYFFDEEIVDGRNALGLYHGGERERIGINRSELSDPVSLVGTLAHEVAHAILLGEGHIDREVDDHEYVTDLLTVFLGLGVFTANSVMRESYTRGGGWYTWLIGSRGYLSERSFGYALALFAWIRGEDGSAWENHLRPHARAIMRDSLTYLSKTGDVSSNPNQGAADETWPAESDELRLIADLRSPHAGARLAALWDIQGLSLQSSQSMGLLTHLLDDENEYVRAEAAKVLARSGAFGEPAVPNLVERALADPNLHVRLHAMQALAEFGKRADDILPAAIYLLKDSDFRVRTAAAKVVGSFGTAAVSATEPLVAGLRDAEIDAAVAAAWALGRIDAKTAVPALVRAFKHGEGDLPYVAADVLADLAPSSNKLVTVLATALGKTDYEKRVHAARALARMGPSAALAVPALMQAYSEEDSYASACATPLLRAQVRLESAVALAIIEGKFGLAADVLRESLPPPLGTATKEALRGDAWCFWDDVLDALRRLGSGIITPLVFQLNNEEDCGPFAAWALGQLGETAKPAAAALENALSRAQPLVRCLAACSLWKIQPAPDQVVPVILDTVQHIESAFPTKTQESPPLSLYNKAFIRLLQGIGEPALPFLIQTLNAGAITPASCVCRAMAAIAMDSETVERSVREACPSWAPKFDNEIKSLKEWLEWDRLRRMTVGPQNPPDQNPIGARAFEDGVVILVEAYSFDKLKTDSQPKWRPM